MCVCSTTLLASFYFCRCPKTGKEGNLYLFREWRWILVRKTNNENDDSRATINTCHCQLASTINLLHIILKLRIVYAMTRSIIIYVKPSSVCVCVCICIVHTSHTDIKTRPTNENKKYSITNERRDTKKNNQMNESNTMHGNRLQHFHCIAVCVCVCVVVGILSKFWLGFESRIKHLPEPKYSSHTNTSSTSEYIEFYTGPW